MDIYTCIYICISSKENLTVQRTAMVLAGCSRNNHKSKTSVISKKLSR